MKKTIYIYLYLALFSSLAISQSNLSNNSNSVKYISGQDGTIKMFVNVWGHVKVPGRVLVLEGTDIPTLLSMVGGPSQGANLSKVYLYRENSDSNGKSIYIINLKNFIDNGDKANFVKILPNDTVIIKQKTTSLFFENLNTVNILLSIINLYLNIK